MSVTTGVVIPSYNHERFVATALESALDQTRVPDRVVVVDDGSTDGSEAILRSFAHDRRITILFQENRGAPKALGRGIDEVETDLVFILNSDDRFAPDRIERFVHLFEDRPTLALAGSWLEVIDACDRTLGIKRGWENLEPWEIEPSELTVQGTADPVANLLQTNYLATTSNFVFTRRLWGRCRPFQPLRFAHDWDFALRASREGELALLPEPLVQYRVHETNTIRQDRRAMELEILWVLAANLPHHLADRANPDLAVRLVHSLPVFGEPRVFSLLAALGGADALDGGRRMESLLDPENPTRRALLEEIAG